MTPISPPDAEAVLSELASVFLGAGSARRENDEAPNVEARYRVLLDQIPAVVFMAYLDQGIGEAYVSPQIEASRAFRRANGWKIRCVVSADSCRG